MGCDSSDERIGTEESDGGGIGHDAVFEGEGLVGYGFEEGGMRQVEELGEEG